MPTEPTISYQDQMNEEKARGILRIWEWVKEHPLCVVLVVVVFLVVLFPLFLAYLRSQGVTEIFGISISEKKPRARKNLGKQISILGPGNVPGIRMPRELVELAETLERDSMAQISCCVVCQNEELRHRYGAAFYHRMKDSTVVKRYGWVNYAKQQNSDTLPTIRQCLFDALRLYNKDQSSATRFDSMMQDFDDPKKHTLLVIEMRETATATDLELEQITGQRGLCVVLFSTEPVKGYDTIQITQKGGATV